MKLLIDMNSPRWVDALGAAGLPAVHWSHVGHAQALDDYVVITHDLDFSAILAATHGTKPSVVQLRADDLSPAAIGETLVAALRQLADELAVGALLTIEPARTRVTLLPLPSNDRA